MGDVVGWVDSVSESFPYCSVCNFIKSLTENSSCADNDVQFDIRKVDK